MCFNLQKFLLIEVSMCMNLQKFLLIEVSRFRQLQKFLLIEERIIFYQPHRVSNFTHVSTNRREQVFSRQLQKFLLIENSIILQAMFQIFLHQFLLIEERRIFLRQFRNSEVSTNRRMRNFCQPSSRGHLFFKTISEASTNRR